MGQENRRVQRLEIALSLSFKVVPTQQYVSLATTVNISATGLCFVTKEKLHPGQDLIVQVTLSKFENVILPIQVVWVKEQFTFMQEEYAVGVKVKDSVDPDVAKFVKFFANSFLAYSQKNK